MSSGPIPSTLLKADAGRFWVAVVLTGVATGLGAAALTRLLEVVQQLMWGGNGRNLLEAAMQVPAWRHIAVLLGAAVITGVGQIGLKVGPGATPADLLALIRRLSPDGEPGRLSLITRIGAGKIRSVLPPLVEAVRAEGIPVAWICDPMHGNTFETPSGYKTRRYDDVLAEVQGFFAVHHRLGTHPGGIHIEFTGDNVTECVGGSHAIVADDLHQRYETACDPRLNRSQALDLAFTVAESYRSA